MEGGKASQRVEALLGCGKNTGDSFAGLLAVRSAAQNGSYFCPWPAHSALAWGLLAGAALESAISVVVYDSGVQHLAGGLARLPDLVSALLVNYSEYYLNI